MSSGIVLWFIYGFFRPAVVRDHGERTERECYRLGGVFFFNRVRRRLGRQTLHQQMAGARTSGRRGGQSGGPSQRYGIPRTGNVFIRFYV